MHQLPWLDIGLHGVQAAFSQKLKWLLIYHTVKFTASILPHDKVSNSNRMGLQPVFD